MTTLPSMDPRIDRAPPSGWRTTMPGIGRADPDLTAGGSFLACLAVRGWRLGLGRRAAGDSGRGADDGRRANHREPKQAR